MKIARRIAALVTAALLCMFSGEGRALTDEDYDYWYEQMTYLVYEIGTRMVGTEGERLAHEYLLEEFERIGYAPGTDAVMENVCEVNGVACTSIVAIKPALHEGAALLTVCAHYDSNAPGARDNASGTAAMLMLARRMAQMDAYPDAEVRFIAFSAEESGHQGSLGYVQELREEEKARSLAVFNIDILAVDVWDTEAAFSVDSMGMRTEDGYVEGTEERPARNKAVRAVEAAMDEVSGFAPEDAGITYCVPRHLGMSDHESFHLSGIDAANVCFRGNVEEGGHWPIFMHTPSDTMGDFELERSYQALDVAFAAVDGLARDARYGD